MTGLLLALVAQLPATIPDPRLGPSSWAVVDLAQVESPPEACGYLVVLPEKPSQAFLERLVSLAADHPVVGLGAAEKAVLQQLDGVVVRSEQEGAALTGCCPGVALVAEAADPAEALRALGWGVKVFLVPGDPPWARALEGAYPEPAPARAAGQALPTAGRASDLALLVALPPGFSGGIVELPTAWVASQASFLVGEGSLTVNVSVHGEEARVVLPAAPEGGLLVVPRPLPPGGLEAVEVRGKRELTAGEILARHHRQVAQQQRVVQSFTAWQRLLVRVYVQELGRSFELGLAGPVFFTPDLERDWELREATVDGAPWPVEDLPELPLIQPKAPPVPPLALELAPSYAYELVGESELDGKRVYVLAFRQDAQGERRWGKAYVDAATFGLLGLDAFQETPRGEVRRSRSQTRNRLLLLEGVPVWLPRTVVGDDTVESFGSLVTVHRELNLEDPRLNDPETVATRAEAWRGERPMIRERKGQAVPLEPDGSGGRREGTGSRKRQSFLFGGVAWDPGFSFPVPLAGYQLLDFAFRGDQHLRLFLAGAVNDLAWSRPSRSWEPSVQIFLQLVPFSNTRFRRDREAKAEEITTFRQKLRLGVARQAGPFRLGAKVGADFLGFSRTKNTAPGFRLPPSTVETWAQIEGFWQKGELIVGAQWERGERLSWRSWGFGEASQPRFSRGELFASFEHAPSPFLKLFASGRASSSTGTDRFSSFSPGGLFGSSGFVGLPGGRVLAEKVAVVKAGVALSASRGQRLELSGSVGWFQNREEERHASPVSGVAVSVTRRGPWGTVLEATLGVPLVAPGPNQPLVQVILLRPLKPRTP